MQSKDILKAALQDFGGTVICVSHDRDFLNGLVDKVYEFGGGHVKEHLGGIYDFLRAKKISNLQDLERSVQVSNTPTNTPPTTAKLELAARFEEAGIEVNCEETESMNDTLQVDYKQKLVTNFDDKAFETINSNGVISRSVLWSVMENVDQTGLFDNSNAEDPLRLRYAAALAFHIDSELTGADAAADIAKIYNSLEATDYSPLLLYYLSYNYGDDKATEWYYEVNEILTSTVGDFDSMTINEKRNTIFYLSANDGNYAEARSQIREYMQANFEKP